MTTFRKSNLLLVMGCLMLPLVQVFNHFSDFSDLVQGSLLGIGLGLILLSFILRKQQLA